MKFFPYEKYTLISPLPPEKALGKLEEAVDLSARQGLFSFSSTSAKPYRGNISGFGFKISRIIGYRNSFLPVIEGSIAGHLSSEVHIIMRMNTAIIIFCCVWMLGTLFAAVGTFAAMVKAGNFSVLGCLPFVMFLLGYTLITGGFKYESIKSKKFLKELFEAEETK